MTLKQFRESKGLTQKQAAELGGLAQGTYSRIERGLRAGRTPAEHRVRKVLAAYNPDAK